MAYYWSKVFGNTKWSNSQQTDVFTVPIAKEENLSEKQNYADEESCVSSLGIGNHLVLYSRAYRNRSTQFAMPLNIQEMLQIIWPSDHIFK